MDHYRGAALWTMAGVSVIPIRADGTKKPLIEWDRYQSQAPTREQIKDWFDGTDHGIALVCGAVSGNLEMFELEGRATDSSSLDKIEVQMTARGILHVWRSLMDEGYMESTPSGGLHFLYRITDHEVPGNQKVARRLALDDELNDREIAIRANRPDAQFVRVLAETRGEGGYVIVAPTSGTVHKTGDSWSVMSGQVGVVPELTWFLRCELHSAIRDALDNMPVREQPERPQIVTEPRSGLAPGDDYNRRIHWADLLVSYGWSYESARGREQFWTRPGKDPREGASATLYYQGSDNLYVFSSSTELPTEEPISKFAFYTFMEHRGDFSAAARALHRAGYGERSSIDISDWFEEAPTDAPSGMGAVVESQTSAVAGSSEAEAPEVARIEQYTEKGVGRFAGQVLKHRIRWVHEENTFRVYDKGVWRKDNDKTVQRLMMKVSDKLDQDVNLIMEKAEEAVAADLADAKEQMAAAKGLKAFAKSIASRRGIEAISALAATNKTVACAAAAFDKDPMKIAMGNGTFDLDKMELVDHDPAFMLTKRIPVIYDPQARADRWLQYLEEVLPDPAFRDYLQRAVGMALLGDTSEAAFFVLWGKTGCGKSQFLEVMKAVFGEYGATAAATTFQESRNGESQRKVNSLHALRGARIVMTSETSERSQLSGELVKRVTGGDTVTSNALYESDISWKPQFTMFMGTNFRPVLDANDGAIWRRVKPIEFPNSFFQDNQPTANREKNLAERIIATELPGVLNWVLEGVLAYRAIGLKDPDQMIAAVKDYREDSDPVLSFLTEAENEGMIIIGEEQRVLSTEIYKIFVEWSRSNGVTHVLGRNKFGQRMEDLGYVSYRGDGGTRRRKGIGINTANPIVGMFRS